MQAWLFDFAISKKQEKVTVCSQNVQQNATLIRHNECEVIAWQRF